MNNMLFRALVVLMSLSLLGIIFVQLYWINSSLEQSEKQFQYQVKQVMGNVSDKLEQIEMKSYLSSYYNLRDSIGTEPKKQELVKYWIVQWDLTTNETISYRSTISSEDFNIDLSFFDKRVDSIPVKNYISTRHTEIYRPGNIKDANTQQMTSTPDEIIDQKGELSILHKSQFEIYFKDIASLQPLSKRISIDDVQNLLTEQFKNYGIHTPFEFAVYSNNLATKIKSGDFKYDKESTYSIPVFDDYENSKDKIELLVSFPDKKRYLFSDLLGIVSISIVFTIIIIVAYISALHQYIKQRQISQIKTDFINNMTHEFKTPIATINLALDAIKSPKVRDDKEKADRYLKMIRDENKRMHAQVESVLRISKLEKQELDIPKESGDIVEIIDNAIEHVRLMVEDREGSITKHYKATRTIALLNEVYFTSVLVNILDNAIKYSPEAPIIDVYTENVKDFILIKIQDKGIGMTKAAQKRAFEKFYREHTGDVHNVKGHGLGLAYVKTIVEDHSGQVFVESEKGKGSTFIIKIPVIN